jgi:hypothetical protein
MKPSPVCLHLTVLFPIYYYGIYGATMAQLWRNYGATYSRQEYQFVRIDNLSKIDLQKPRFLATNCPTLAKNAVIRGIRKTQMRFSNG